MPSRTNAIALLTTALLSTVLLTTAAYAQTGTYALPPSGAGSWPLVLSSVNLQPAPASVAQVLVNPAALRDGAIHILEGDTPLARSLGIVPQPGEPQAVRNVIDARAPQLQIIWREAVSLPAYRLPAAAQVFAHERWTRAPLMAGLQHGRAAVLWVATAPGAQGFERFPYLLHALRDLGLTPPITRAASGLSSIGPTAPASISITSPSAGASPASPPCM